MVDRFDDIIRLERLDEENRLSKVHSSVLTSEYGEEVKGFCADLRGGRGRSEMLGRSAHFICCVCPRSSSCLPTLEHLYLPHISRISGVVTLNLMIIT